MNKIGTRLWRLLIPLLTILTTGCGLFQLYNPTLNPQIPITGGTEAATSQPIAPDTPTETLTQTASPAPTNTPVPYVVPTTPSMSGAVCDEAAFVQDITIPDGTQLTAGDQFQKIWRLENTGSCIWSPNYRIIFDRGDILGAPASINMPNTVNPGQAVDISVTMTVPTTNGTYRGDWRIMDPNGSSFGIGAGGSTDFFVVITVGSPPTSFRVKHILMSVNTGSASVNCPPGFPFTLYGQIETNQPGNVTYHWEFSNGTNSNQSTIAIGNSMIQTVATTFNPNISGNYWGRIFDDSPNHQLFSKVFFTLTCLKTSMPTPTLTPVQTPTPTQTPTQTPMP